MESSLFQFFAAVVVIVVLAKVWNADYKLGRLLAETTTIRTLLQSQIPIPTAQPASPSADPTQLKAS